MPSLPYSNRFILLVLVAVLGLAFAKPASLAVYPFEAQETELGVALADRFARAFGELEVYGPELTPALIPPLLVEGGFINPVVVVSGQGSGDVLTGLAGAQLLRRTLGVDAVLTGRLQVLEDELELRLVLVSEVGVRQFSLTAPEAEPGLLVSRALPILESVLGPATPDPEPLDLSGLYGREVHALALLGAGETERALSVLVNLLQEEHNPRWLALRRDIDEVFVGRGGTNPVVSAVASLGLETLNTANTLKYFERWRQETDLPSADLWVATLRASLNDREGAGAAFADAAVYDYGRAAGALYQAVQGGGESPEDLEALKASESPAVLLAASLAARSRGDVELELALLEHLSTVAPSLPYAFERISFIAFDQDEPLMAAQALVIATGLVPDSSLYWTNLGWAYYLLGFHQRSEEASLKAVALDDSQYIALYNLGLTRTVTGRLDEAMHAYEDALRRDPEVDDEAIRDLERALDEYPSAVGVHYALANLYEMEGRRDEAAEQYERFLARSTEAPFASQAESRLQVLRAPPPPIELSTDVKLRLGRERQDLLTFQPGDRIYPLVELYTPGFELPDQVIVNMSLTDAQGAEVVSLGQQVTIPRNVVSIVLNDISLDLPTELESGSYTLQLRVSTEDDQRANRRVAFEVSGRASFARQLLSREIVLRGLDSGLPLVSNRTLSDGDQLLVAAMVQELRNAREAAEAALPEVEQGRFAGLSGGELFLQSGPGDVRDFLTFFLAQGAGNVDFAFVDAYAQWALEGAPTP